MLTIFYLGPITVVRIETFCSGLAPSCLQPRNYSFLSFIAQRVQYHDIDLRTYNRQDSIASPPSRDASLSRGLWSCFITVVRTESCRSLALFWRLVERMHQRPIHFSLSSKSNAIILFFTFMAQSEFWSPMVPVFRIFMRFKSLRRT